jgi:DeoR/GlpR family transcriptional regulator of sugar metabolism
MQEPDTAIPSALARHGPATCPELAAVLGTHPATVRRRCMRLQREGRIRRTTGGAYALGGTNPVAVRRASD